MTNKFKDTIIYGAFQNSDLLTSATNLTIVKKCDAIFDRNLLVSNNLNVTNGITCATLTLSTSGYIACNYGIITDLQFSYIAGLTSNIQNQLNTISGQISYKPFTAPAIYNNNTFTIILNNTQCATTAYLTSYYTPLSTLNNYALTSSLNNYVLNTSISSYVLTTTLSNYALTSSLSNYILNTSISSYVLTTTLSNYALTSSLNNYSLITSLSGIINTYINNNNTYLFSNSNIWTNNNSFRNIFINAGSGLNLGTGSVIIAASATITDTQISYLSTLTSNIQTQFNNIPSATFNIVTTAINNLLTLNNTWTGTNGFQDIAVNSELYASNSIVSPYLQTVNNQLPIFTGLLTATQYNTPTFSKTSAIQTYNYSNSICSTFTIQPNTSQTINFSIPISVGCVNLGAVSTGVSGFQMNYIINVSNYIVRLYKNGTLSQTKIPNYNSLLTTTATFISNSTTSGMSYDQFLTNFLGSFNTDFQVTSANYNITFDIQLTVNQKLISGGTNSSTGNGFIIVYTNQQLYTLTNNNNTGLTLGNIGTGYNGFTINSININNISTGCLNVSNFNSIGTSFLTNVSSTGTTTLTNLLVSGTTTLNNLIVSTTSNLSNLTVSGTTTLNNVNITGITNVSNCIINKTQLFFNFPTPQSLSNYNLFYSTDVNNTLLSNILYTITFTFVCSGNIFIASTNWYWYKYSTINNFYFTAITNTGNASLTSNSVSSNGSIGGTCSTNGTYTITYFPPNNSSTYNIIFNSQTLLFSCNTNGLVILAVNVSFS